MRVGGGCALGGLVIGVLSCGCGSAGERPEGWTPEPGSSLGGDSGAGVTLGGDESRGGAEGGDPAGPDARIGAVEGSTPKRSELCREGETEPCLGFVEQVHDIRYCWEGVRVCRDGKWSPCEPPQGSAVPTARPSGTLPP
jgi:hypothetical protein